jgi:hypothetical protein
MDLTFQPTHLRGGDSMRALFFLFAQAVAASAAADERDGDVRREE